MPDPYLAYLFGSGSVPMATAAAKEMLEAAFGKSPEKSYYEGCSLGGRDELMASSGERRKRGEAGCQLHLHYALVQAPRPGGAPLPVCSEGQNLFVARAGSGIC